LVGALHEPNSSPSDTKKGRGKEKDDAPTFHATNEKKSCFKKRRPTHPNQKVGTVATSAVNHMGRGFSQGKGPTPQGKTANLASNTEERDNKLCAKKRRQKKYPQKGRKSTTQRGEKRTESYGSHLHQKVRKGRKSGLLN